MADTDKSLRPGTILQGEQTYRIERVLGSGGFGITYLASTTIQSMDAPVTVAIKEHFLSSHCERGSDTTQVVCPGTQNSRMLVANSLKDFISEARRLAQYGAGHDSIVKVSEVFEANGTAYYVMEYLDGCSLGEYILEYGPLSEEEIRTLIVPVVDAVAHLHRHRLTHLDIKPANIMLDAPWDGVVRPVLIDFGLSKHYNEDGSATSTINTMAYSDGYSPAEQYSGIRSFSPTADVYALGATLYDAATGRRPAISTEWPAGEPAATIAALPLSASLRMAMTTALAPRKNERYPDAGALLAALGSGGGAIVPPVAPTAAEVPTAVRPVAAGQSYRPRYNKADDEPTSRKPWFYVAIAAIVLAVAGAIIGFMSRGGDSNSDYDAVAGLVDTVDNQVNIADIPGKYTPEQLAEIEARRQQEIAERERQRREEEAAAERERQRQEAEAAAAQESQRQDELSETLPHYTAPVEAPAPAPQPEQNNQVYTVAMLEQAPSFPGGKAEMYRFVSNTLMYPTEAAEENVQGRVFVEFVVDRDGSISNARIVSGRHPALDREALRVVNAMPRWNPGLNNGHPVRVSYTLPITFRLSTGE